MSLTHYCQGSCLIVNRLAPRQTLSLNQTTFDAFVSLCSHGGQLTFSPSFSLAASSIRHRVQRSPEAIYYEIPSHSSQTIESQSMLQATMESGAEIEKATRTLGVLEISSLESLDWGL